MDLEPGDMSLASIVPAAKRRKKSANEPVQEQQEQDLVHDDVPEVEETKDDGVGQLECKGWATE